MIKLSATRVSSFLQCPQKYWFSYVKKLPKKSNPSFKLGLACHEALEFAGNIRMKRKLTDKDKEAVLNKYDEVSVSEGIENMSVHKEGKKIVKDKLESFNKEKIIAVEEKFGFGKDSTKTESGVPLIGAIDKVIEVDRETLVVIDYKTSNTALTPDQLESDLQLSIYDYVARTKWPGYKRYILSLDYLKSEPIYTYRHEEERDELNKYLKEVYTQMCNLTEDKVVPRLNMFCSWCDFKENCPKYMKVCSKKDYVFSDLALMSNEEIYKEWNDIKDTVKLLSARERDISSVIMEKVVENDETVANDGKEAYVRQNSNKAYDVEMLSKVIPYKDLLKMVRTTKSQIDKYLKDHPEHKNLVENAISVNYSRPFLSKRKHKK